MRKSLLASTAAAFIAGGVLFNASPARADFFDSAGIIAAITALQSATQKFFANLGTQLTQSFESNMTNLGNVVNAQLGSGFTQISNYQKAQIGAVQQIADASNMVNARTARDIRNAQLRDQHSVNPQDCAALDGGQSTVVAATNAQAVQAAVRTLKDRRTRAEPETPSWVGQAQGTQAANQNHYSRYCSPAEQQAGLCSGVTSDLQDADQDVGSLTGEPTYANQDKIDAANDYLTNLLQPVAPAALRGSSLTSAAGQDALLKRREYNAQMSLAQDVGGDVLGWHAATVQLTQAQQQEMTNEGLTATATGSEEQAIDLEVRRRFSGVQWHANLQAIGEKSVMVEIATEIALSNYLSWQNFQLAQKAALVNAAILSNQADGRLKTAITMPTATVQ